MRFTRLRLAGFKSFVEPTELVIETGLTGVVGPNGCGKSNLVEALRWVMGETSARQMRGSEMDDVIFGGTSGRPPRNLAEVTLGIENSERRAPAAFNDAEELEVTRRIERDKGSLYRVNGRESRARDVQLLFADAATGAHSPSLVSQGRISALINARPSDRRAILEDAAGIAGLQSRRHEAELRLKAAEGNMERLEDVMTTLDTQLQQLKRQARQAQRYRTLSEQIRRAEAVLLAARWADISARREAAAEALRAAETSVGAAQGAASVAAAALADAAALLPALRQTEAEAAAELQRVTLARGELDAEERRVAEAAKATAERLVQIDRDLEREKQLAEDASAAMAKLVEEQTALQAAQAGEQAALDAAKSALVEAEAAAEKAEAELSELTRRLAAAEARRAGLDRRLSELEARDRRIAAELADAEGRRQALQKEVSASPSVEAGEAELARAQAAVEAARTAMMAAGERRAATATADAEARRLAQDASGKVSRLTGEIDGLAASLAAGVVKGADPVLDALTVEPGCEAALGAALGDDLSAPLGGSGRRWDELEPIEAAPLPVGAEPLAAKVSGVPALARRLDAVGIVADRAAGVALQATLRPGQRLVSIKGDLWRWDGFAAPADAPSPAAVRLAQRNRLAALRKEREGAETERAMALATAEQARQAAQDADAAERAARTAERAAADAAARAQQDLARRVAQAAQAQSKLAAIEQAAGRLDAERTELQEARVAAQAERAAEPDPQAGREQAASARAILAERRATALSARGARDRLTGEADGRRRRLAAIAGDLGQWQARSTGAGGRLADLQERRRAAELEAESLAAVPATLAERRTSLFALIANAEQARRDAADALAKGEARQSETDRLLRAAEAEVATRREARVRAEGEVEQAVREAQAVAERIRERLNCRPDQAAAAAEIGEDEEAPTPEEAAQRLERHSREREGMGPVNLRAETEATELDTQIGGMQAEREDLVQAIQRLRAAIGSLNREGRERLLASFEKVNAHFERLFQHLFGGGRAHLELTESEDPLASGLEIMASPPGKRLQVLSLLSGGEQALTALSLIFAVFLTNPSPICVLDEVDAPLDDSNVDRFCSLLSEIAGETGTRFLVVTHHRMTMARMDRLFGVTMMERGVSQLVSVDLAGAERIVGD